jgi:hypothetical protein
MFEEAQLYSPATTGEDGTVTVHLSADHPGRNDPAYRERRNAIAAQALTWTAGERPPVIDYLESEQEVWRTVQRELAIKHEKYACRAVRDAAHRNAGHRRRSGAQLTTAGSMASCRPWGGRKALVDVWKESTGGSGAARRLRRGRSPTVLLFRRCGGPDQLRTARTWPSAPGPRLARTGSGRTVPRPC